MGIEKIKIWDGGRYVMVVNSCFKDLEGRVGLKSVGVCSKGGKKRNERVKVSNDSCFW